MFKRLKYHIAVFFSVVGPGFITAVVDNDAGGIFTYSQAGAKYGYLPLWTLLPIMALLIVTQEMCSRMGAVTGKKVEFVERLGVEECLDALAGEQLALFVLTLD